MSQIAFPPEPKLQKAYIIQHDDLNNYIDAQIERKLQSFKNITPERESEELLTRKETASILGVSLQTVHTWVLSNKLTAYRIGSRIRFKKSEVESSLKKVMV